MDSANRRLYVSHATSVEVVDPDAGKIVGTISGLHGVHGIAIAQDLGKGFITNGQSGSVTIFDLKTLKPVKITASGVLPAFRFKVVAGRIGTGSCGTKTSNLKSCAISVANATKGDSGQVRITFK